MASETIDRAQMTHRAHWSYQGYAYEKSTDLHSSYQEFKSQVLNIDSYRLRWHEPTSL